MVPQRHRINQGEILYFGAWLYSDLSAGDWLTLQQARTS